MNADIDFHPHSSVVHQSDYAIEPPAISNSSLVIAC